MSAGQARCPRTSGAISPVSHAFACYIGNGELTASLFRKLNIGPIMKQTSASTGTVRVTSSSLPPTAGLGATNFDVVNPGGMFAQVEWTNTSTSYANVARKSLTIVPAPGYPYTWITVEYKTSASTLSFYGFHEWWMSELGG